MAPAAFSLPALPTPTALGRAHDDPDRPHRSFVDLRDQQGQRRRSPSTGRGESPLMAVEMP